VTVDDVPAYSGEPYVEVNDNQPEFTEEELTTVSYEEYSELDELGRCQSAEACIGQDLMPTETRESISSVKPTVKTSIRYMIRNRPPPSFAARYGNLHKFPKPTALPAAASTNPMPPEKLPLFLFSIK
jgi:hypothetical protein